MDPELTKIKKIVGEDSFKKGIRFSKSAIIYDYKNTVLTKEKEIIHSFMVQSEQTLRKKYHVSITKKNDEIIDTDCNCLQFESWGTCKHVAACFIHFREEMERFSPENRKLFLSKKILKEFYHPKDKGKIKIKKQLDLAVELEFYETYYTQGIQVKLKIGEDKLYSLNNKMSEFLSQFDQEENQIIFGKNFTYDSSKHYFSKQDEKIINYFVDWYKKDPYNNFKQLILTEEQFTSFLTLLENIPFSILNYGRIDKIARTNPLSLLLQKKEDYYRLSIMENDFDFLTENCRYLVKNHTLYEIPLKSSKILSLMQQNGLHDLEFKEEDLELFHQGILPLIKQNIMLDKTVENQFILGVKPQFKLYFDIKSGIVFCNIMIIYQEQEIDYFEENPHIIRDSEEEQSVLEELLSYGFQINQEKIYMDEIDTIGEFLEQSIIELAKKY